ncbi:hypothetical protein SDC9_144760 [bioreactor metagenome]|uniref:Uncharacterized protein n=1 Tax=bioreactor metagenome TaxID=1076179 RepID=A0A645E7W8_9ZZZZ
MNIVVRKAFVLNYGDNIVVQYRRAVGAGDGDGYLVCVVVVRCAGIVGRLHGVCEGQSFSRREEVKVFASRVEVPVYLAACLAVRESAVRYRKHIFEYAVCRQSAGVCAALYDGVDFDGGDGVFYVDVGERESAGLREGGVSLRERGAVMIRSSQRNLRSVVCAGNGYRQRLRRRRAVFVGDDDVECVRDSLADAERLYVIGAVIKFIGICTVGVYSHFAVCAVNGGSDVRRASPDL